MTTKDTGGSAFPVTENGPHGNTHTEFGMTLRDYFAAQALIPIISSAGTRAYHAAAAARYAYELADGMLEERAK
jgi:hypothetical protein